MGTTLSLPGKLARRARACFARRLFKRVLEVRLIPPLISFTFDDFPASAFRVGGRILRERGLAGTFYASLGLMGGVKLGPQFTLDDLHELVREGHELACHTYSHMRCRDVPPEQYEQDVLRNLTEAARLLPGVRLRNFAYPDGDVGPACKRRLERRFRSLRGIRPGVNARRADLNLLRANPVYEHSVGPSQPRAMIRENCRLHGWLIFYTHDVSDRPSPYGCTPELLASVVREAQESGARIATVDQALCALGVVASNEPGTGNP